MNDAVLVGFSQSVTDLLGDSDSLACAQPAHLSDQPFQITSDNIFHCDEMCPLVFAEIEHLADILVADLSGKLQLVAESLDGLPV